MRRWFRELHWRSKLDLLTTVAMLLAAVVLIWVSLRVLLPQSKQSQPSLSIPSDAIDVAAYPSLGSPSAPVTVIEFSDLLCPFCRRFSIETLPGIRESLVDTGEIRFVFVHFPVERLHPLAKIAAQMAECGHQKSRFWEIHDVLQRVSQTDKPDTFVAAVGEAGVSRADLQDCMAKGAAASVEAQIGFAKQLGVSATPSFLFGKTDKTGKVRAVSWMKGAVDAKSFADEVHAIR